MAGKVIDFRGLTNPDQLGTQIAMKWVEWNALRVNKINSWKELRQYIFQTDTSQTTNSKLPWKNKTSIPKICQIRDNLHANYTAAIFPKRKWLEWDADRAVDADVEKREAILSYMEWVVSQERFREEVDKLVLDYIDYGNCFATVEWIDERQNKPDTPYQIGYTGPALQRISPLDIVFNPVASTFVDSPKIVRSLLNLGEVKMLMERESAGEDAQFYEDLYNYMIELRATVRNSTGSDLHIQDSYYAMDGFSSMRAYLESDYVEVLTFYGDIFDWENKKLLKNHKVMVVDRHKVVSKKPNPSYFGFPPIFHVGWRMRQDNLWAMGPLDNLVGMQYRVDHVENLKADVFDLNAFPVFKVKGHVEDFNWGPGEKIYLGEEGDVEMVAPAFQILQANVEVNNYMNIMEEMAGSPKEAMGFRTPGEKTAYEVQRLENAAARIFNVKIMQLEIQGLERWLNAMLEVGRRNMNAAQEISVFDDEYKIQTFMTLTPQDIVGSGKVKPIAARHFAEKAELVQNLTNFYASGPGQDPDVRNHLSGIELARTFEELLQLQNYKIVQPYVRISEQADAMRLANAAHESIQNEALAPTGTHPADHTMPDMPPTGSVGGPAGFPVGAPQ